MSLFPPFAAALIAGALFATSGSAQTAGASAPTYGPPLAGICVFDEPRAVDQSRAGAGATQQIAQFAQGVRGELDAQRAAIVADDRALAARKAALPQADFQQRVTQLRQRYQALEDTQKLREAQLVQTRRDAVGQIAKALNPALTEIVTARRCSVVLGRGAIFGANAAMDISPQVIERMNARLPTLNLRLAPPEAVKQGR